jgi:outer membrane biosynthesis protein TonB
VKRIPDEDKAGLYLTVIIHLAVLIVLLASGLGYSLNRENSFVLDFSRQEEIEKMQEEIEKLQEEAAFKEGVSQRLQQILAESGVGSRESEVKNVAVNRGALKDDRGTDAEQLYKDAERLQKELSSGYEVPDEDHAALSSPTPDSDNSGRKSEPAQSYSGPSVIAYELEGRKASYLPIPAYRCMGAGQVKVIIGVNPKGQVLSAKVDESSSSKDGCLRSFAIRAARLSKFSISTSAPSRQSGYIIYEFIAQ